MRLVVDNLAAARGGERIFEGVSFALSAGEGLAVTGPNGAGKTTLLRVLAGLLRAADGSVILEGAGDAPLAAQAHFLGPGNAFKPGLTVRENLDFWRGFSSHPASTPDEALTRVGLARVIDVPFSDLSTGQRRRVAIARLFCNERPIWILDEPTSGLDAQSEGVFAGFIRDKLMAGGIVIAATHLPLGVDRLKTLRFSEGGA